MYFFLDLFISTFLTALYLRQASTASLPSPRDYPATAPCLASDDSHSHDSTRYVRCCLCCTGINNQLKERPRIRGQVPLGIVHCAESYNCRFWNILNWCHSTRMKRPRSVRSADGRVHSYSDRSRCRKIPQTRPLNSYCLSLFLIRHWFPSHRCVIDPLFPCLPPAFPLCGRLTTDALS